MHPLEADHTPELAGSVQNSLVGNEAPELQGTKGVLCSMRAGRWASKCKQCMYCQIGHGSAPQKLHGTERAVSELITRASIP